MTLLWWFTAYFMFISILQTNETQAVPASCKRRCPDIPQKAVCGTDLHTYGNMCKLQSMACHNISKKIEKAYDGVCHEDCGEVRAAKKIFVEQFFKNNGECNILGTISERTLNLCLRIQFNKAKKNGEDFLSYRTFVQIFQKFKKHKRGRKCMRRLARFCDENKDKKITFDEVLKGFTQPKSKSVRSAPSCRGEKFGFQCEKNDNTATPHCVLSICYCSAPSGNILVHFKKEERKKYNCDKVRADYNTHEEDKASCTESNQEDVIDGYRKHIEDEIFANAPELIKPKSMSMKNYLDERDLRSLHKTNTIINWKFGRLDKNQDGELDAEELKLAKVELSSTPQCIQYILKTCNLNKDNYFSRKEWRHCFGYKNEKTYKETKMNKKINKETAKLLPSQGGCPPVPYCTLSCLAGYERVDGCITCKCKVTCLPKSRNRVFLAGEWGGHKDDRFMFSCGNITETLKVRMEIP